MPSFPRAREPTEVRSKWVVIVEYIAGSAGELRRDHVVFETKGIATYVVKLINDNKGKT